MQTKYSISTYDGSFFDFHNPTNFSFDIETIAHALSNICRYGGHSNRFYSVAEHSILVSEVVPAKLALCGLLHDASEAFVGDMPSPLKALCQSYRDIEDKVHEAICAQYNLPFPFPSDIKLADKMVYRAERDQVTCVPDTLWHTEIAKAKVVVMCYPPEEAKFRFMERYRELTEPRYTKTNGE